MTEYRIVKTGRRVFSCREISLSYNGSFAIHLIYRLSAASPEVAGHTCTLTAIDWELGSVWIYSAVHLHALQGYLHHLECSLAARLPKAHNAEGLWTNTRLPEGPSCDCSNNTSGDLPPERMGLTVDFHSKTAMLSSCRQLHLSLAGPKTQP